MTRKKRIAILGSENHWTGGIVPYSISDIFSGESVFYVYTQLKIREMNINVL